jgi:tetratricopeptide (TPR) repeat protein
MRRQIALLATLLLPSVSLACLWDYDTLKQERARFPDALELITGKFLRHSPEFYQWRIQDRLKKLKTDPKNPALYDDLAVAYAKTGHYEKAIETISAVEKFAPGRYETYSNLGTFYFLKGDVEKALPIIDKALAINPDAHFGREKYQKWLGEYLVKWGGQGGFRKYLDASVPGRLTDENAAAAVKAVLGMMRFANHDNPVLLEALAELLAHEPHGGRPEIDAKRLAARAYLKRGYTPKDRTFISGYVDKAKQVLEMQTRHGQTTQQLTVEELASQFKEELADAEAWYADLRAKEVGWIQSGQNPEAEFDKLYADEPRVPDEPTDEFPQTWSQRNRYGLLAGIGIGVLSAGLLGVIYLVWRFGRRA